MHTTAKLITEALEARGWNQADLAQVIGRSRQWVNGVLRGRMALSYTMTHRIEVALSRRLRLMGRYEGNDKEMEAVRRAARRKDDEIKQKAKSENHKAHQSTNGNAPRARRRSG